MPQPKLLVRGWALFILGFPSTRRKLFLALFQGVRSLLVICASQFIEAVIGRDTVKVRRKQPPWLVGGGGPVDLEKDLLDHLFCDGRTPHKSIDKALQGTEMALKQTAKSSALSAFDSLHQCIIADLLHDLPYILLVVSKARKNISHDFFSIFGSPKPRIRSSPKEHELTWMETHLF